MSFTSSIWRSVKNALPSFLGGNHPPESPTRRSGDQKRRKHNNLSCAGLPEHISFPDICGVAGVATSPERTRKTTKRNSGTRTKARASSVNYDSVFDAASIPDLDQITEGNYTEFTGTFKSHYSCAMDDKPNWEYDLNWETSSESSAAEKGTEAPTQSESPVIAPQEQATQNNNVSNDTLSDKISLATKCLDELANISIKPHPARIADTRLRIRLMGAEQFLKGGSPGVPVVKNDAEARARVSAYCESVGRVLPANRNNGPGFYGVECKKCNSCIQHRRTKDGEWKLTSFIPPNKEHCECITSENKPHAYTAEQLAPALCEALEADPKLKCSLAATILSQHLTRTPSQSLVHKVIRVARSDKYGYDHDQASLMMAIKSAYEEKGHIVNIFQTTKANQRKILYMQAKKDHELKIKREKIPKGDPRRKFVVPEDLYSVLDEYDENTDFLYGYDLIFAHAPDLVHKLKTVFSADAAHLRGSLPGTAFGTWGQDANGNIVCICLSVCFDNESEDTWARHNMCVKKNCPGIDKVKNVTIADGDKGFAGSFDKIFEDASKFLCFKHKHDNLATRGGKGDTQVYYKAVYRAVNESHLKSITNDYTAKGEKYMSKSPDKELYPVFLEGRLCGKTTSQVSESANAANLKFRGTYVATGLMLFFEQEMDRISKNKERSELHDLERDGPITPHARKVLKKLKDDRESLGVARNVSRRRKNGPVKVSSAKGGRISYEVKGKLDCSCGYPKITSYPCAHIYEKYERYDDKGNEAVKDLFEEKDWATTWKDQYSSIDPQGTRVARNNVYQHNIGRHLLPVVFKTKRGRPREHNRKKSKVEQSIARAKKSKK